MRDTAGEQRSRKGERDRHPARCANCGITIDGDDDRADATQRASSNGGGGGDVFCCDGCADGGPCIC